MHCNSPQWIWTLSWYILSLCMEQQMGGESINCPLLLSAVIFVITHLQSPIKKKSERLSWCLCRVLSSPPLSAAFFFLLLPVINSVSPRSLSSLFLLPLSSPLLLVLPRGPWCSRNGLYAERRGELSYILYIYIYKERDPRSVSLLFLPLFSISSPLLLSSLSCPAHPAATD